MARLVPKVQRSQEPQGVTAVAALATSQGGASASFLIRADDQNRYWCKAINNPTSPRILVNEQLAGRLGQLIGAPTCRVVLVNIPEALVGWEFRAGFLLQAGWVHGSLAVEGVIETRSLDHRTADDNARRHAGLYALYDWLSGQDAQWLICGQEQNAYYSHDHGHYFPGGPDWTLGSLQQQADTPMRLGVPSAGLDPGELGRLADRLDALTEAELLSVASTIPANWPVADADLDALMAFLLHRAGKTAERLRAMMGPT